MCVAVAQIPYRAGMLHSERPTIQDRPPAPFPCPGEQWEVIRIDGGDAQQSAEGDFDVGSSITGPGMQTHSMARGVAEAWVKQDTLLFGSETIRNWQYTVAILEDTPLRQSPITLEDRRV